MLAIYIPCKNKKEATEISTALLNKKLIACSNLFSSTSLYFWKEKLKTNKEVIIIAKTTEENYPALEKKVLSLHSYSCPCISAWKIDHVNIAYENWVKQVLI